MKVNESLKTIFYLPHYASLLREANFKIDHTHFSKLCLLKSIILLEKQHFRISQHSNNCKKVEESIKPIVYFTDYKSL